MPVVPPDSLPEYVRAAIEEEVHRPGSVDRRLIDAQTLVTTENQAELYRPPGAPAGAQRWPRPWLDEIVAELTAGSVHAMQRAVALRGWVASVPRQFPEGGISSRDGYWGHGYRRFLSGGAEEEVIHKGSPLAIELCRVLVTMASLAGLPARIVLLYADQRPFRHAVVEIHLNGRWSVFDVISNRTFAWPKHGYASAWEIARMPALIDSLQDHHRLRYVDSRFYRTIAIAEYDPWDLAHRYPWDPIDQTAAARLAAGEAS
jgi:hypothetical protein